MQIREDLGNTGDAIKNKFLEVMQGRLEADSYNAINWNELEEDIDKHVWDKLNSQHWIDTRFVISNDIEAFSNLTMDAQDMLSEVFIGLTTLDTLQGIDSGLALQIETDWSQHARAVLAQIQYMEHVHAKFYSTVYATLLTSKRVREIFEFGKQNKHIQFKAKVIGNVYTHGTLPEKLIASVLLESFLFYSGFYAPLRLAGDGKMINTADGIRKISADEKAHGAFLGAKFQRLMKTYSPEEQDRLKNLALSLLFELYENEMSYTEELYDKVGWTDDVKRYVRYNGNIALGNLGMPAIFPETILDFDKHVANALRISSSNGDFFSTVNATAYAIGESEAISESDYSMIKTLAKVTKL